MSDKHILESAFGAVRPLATPEDFEKRIRQAKGERAERLVAKLALLGTKRRPNNG